VSSSRSPIVAALTDPAIYPHAVNRVELVETHISWVFLAGDRVYKVKKPVDLGFLDFTTLERRRFLRGRGSPQPAARCDQRPEAAAKARDRFALAMRYIERRDRPRLLITSGVIGSGKSTVARQVAARLGAIVVRTDAVRKRLAGLALSERHPVPFGEGLYRPEMVERTYAEAMSEAAKILESGWPVVVDGAFSSAAQRRLAREAAMRAGVAFAVLWCDAPDPVLAERLRRRAHDPGEVSDAGVALLPEHRARYEPPVRESNVIRIDTTAAADGAAAAALDALGRRAS